MSKVTTRVTSSHWGAFNVSVRDDKIVGVSPFHNDPDPSSISSIIPAAVHHRTRVARPAVRKSWLENGPHHAESRKLRGSEAFVELPWDEALDIASAELGRVVEHHGNEAIFGGSYGWASAGRFHHALSQVHRFSTVLADMSPLLQVIVLRPLRLSCPMFWAAFSKTDVV